MRVSRPKAAKCTVRLPKEASAWSIHRIQVWCREELCGAPPAIPKEEGSGAPIKWTEAKNYAGRKIDLSSHFPGLIINDQFCRAHTLPMKKDGARIRGGHIGMDNISDVSAVGKNIELLEQFWERIEKLVDWYNLVDMKDHPNPCGMMLRAGKEIHEIMQQANSGSPEDLVTRDSMRYSVAAWGVGHPRDGYGETVIEQSLKLYHWLPDADESHPIFPHRTTPIMKLIRAESKDFDRWMNLFNAYDSGPLKGLKDQELHWAVGLSSGSFPHPDRWDELRELGDTIVDGGSLSDDQTSTLKSILSEAFSSTGDAG